MSTYLKQIESLITFLPESDIIIANKLIKKHDIEALFELTSSAFVMSRKSKICEDIGSKYYNTDTSKLEELRAVTYNYLLQQPLEYYTQNEGDEEDYYE